MFKHANPMRSSMFFFFFFFFFFFCRTEAHCCCIYPNALHKCYLEPLLIPKDGFVETIMRNVDFMTCNS